MLLTDYVRYNLGFIAASLRAKLTRNVATAYLDLCDWEVAEDQVLATNTLQCRNQRSAVRLERKLRQR